MKKFKPSALSVALVLGGLQLASMPNFAFAEESLDTEKAQETKSIKKDHVEVIEVTGFRGSIIKSLNTKRFSDTVVDAISADDIGGLPDVSIADALTRLPGVTSIRLDGQSSELNIRGLSGNFVFSTLNGREQVSSAGGRSVQFDQFPSELISQAQVYKSQKASLIEGGVAGSVELKTANALDMEEDHSFRFSAHGNYNEASADNEDSDTFGRRLTASYKGKFFDDTVGVALGASSMFQPTVSSRFVNYEFDDISITYDQSPEELLVSNGFEINERGGEDERNAFVLALNWNPSDEVRFQFDAFHSKFDSNKWDRGLLVKGLNNLENAGTSIWLDNPILSPGEGDELDSLVGGTFYRDVDDTVIAPPNDKSMQDLNVQTQADDNTTNSKISSLGLNAEWDISDDLTMSVDIAHSEGDETYKDQVMRLAYFEDSSAAVPVIDDNIILSYELNGLDLPNIQFNQDFTDLNHMMVTSVESYPHVESNSSDAIKIDFIYQLDNDFFSSIEAGIRVSTRDYEVSRGRFVYGTTDGAMRNGAYVSKTPNDGCESFEDEGETYYSCTPFQLTSEYATTTTIGGDLSYLPGFLSVNNDKIIDAWIPNVDRTPLSTWEHGWTMTQGNKVKEDVTAIYLQANIYTELFTIPLTGNIGIRAVETEQSSTGLLNVGAGNGDAMTDDAGVVSDEWIMGTEGVTYTDYLPSLNLNFQITDNDQLRFAYAKVMARPEMPTMANSGAWSFDVNRDGDGRNYVGLNSSTSPLLRPFYANQIDISYEHYFTETDGAFIFAIWNKDIKNMVSESSDKNFDFEAAGLSIPNTPTDKVEDDDGNVLLWENGTYDHAENNGDGGYIRGVEIAYTQTFGFLPGAWSGLGANINFSYTESEILVPSKVPGEEGEPGPLEGLSPRVYSATLFYTGLDEKLDMRVSARHRAEYLSEQLAIGEEQSAYFADETIISAQASYRFTDNLQAVISVDNLTDEPNISYFGSQARTGTIQYFGRTIYFGVNYTM
ncbi:MAG: TonB-dependent receptor [Colwellia sp.]